MWYKVPLPVPKSSPQEQGRTPAPMDLSCRWSFSLLHNTVECLLGYWGWERRRCKLFHSWYESDEICFQQQWFSSADSMPCSLCCETYNHSLLASLHSTGLHLHIGVLVVELHNRWKTISRSSQTLRRWSSLWCADAYFLSCPMVHSKQCMSHCSSTLVVHRWLAAWENLLKGLSRDLMLVAIMLHCLRICGMHFR